MSISQEQELEILLKYQSKQFNTKELAFEYKLSQGGIWLILKKNGIPIDKDIRKSSKYTIDEYYFDVVDTKEKAYFLGLMYADGYNDLSTNRFSIALQEKDVHILEEFKKYLKSNIPLRLKNIKRKHPNRQNQYLLRVSSKRLSNSLNNLGCVKAKSLILKFPKEEQIPLNFLKYFILGVFDGDGCFCVYRTKSGDKGYGLSIVSTKDFCEQLAIVIKENLDIHSTICHSSDKEKPTRIISIGGRKQIYKFLDWIYEDATVYLHRKHDKYLAERLPV